MTGLGEDLVFEMSWWNGFCSMTRLTYNANQNAEKEQIQTHLN